ncbi:MAG: hypothetical protein ABJP70_08780 [Erythrobacter sp.]
MKLAKSALGTLTLGALALGACGEVADNPEMLEEFAKTCRSSFVEEGGPAEMADGFCDCSLDKVKEQELGPMDMFDQEKMTTIGEDCAKELIASQSAPE